MVKQMIAQPLQLDFGHMADRISDVFFAPMLDDVVDAGAKKIKPGQV